MSKVVSNSSNLQVLYEDNHIIVINKRPGDIVQGDRTGDTPLSDIVKLYLKKKYNKPGNVYLGVVHRLDRPTSGIVLFAKTSKALPRLNKLFAEKQANKTYLAVVKSPPPKPEDRLIHWLRKNHKKNKSTAFNSRTSHSKKAILSYKLITSLDHYHVLEIQLETGRHHQIRAQLSAIGCPIKGDLKYGFDRSNKDASISLHARRLVLTHPVKKDILSLEAPLPESDIWLAVT